MSLSLSDAVGHKWMPSFVGTDAPTDLLETIARQPIAGVTLYRALNVKNPAQVRELNAALQRAARASNQPPLLIAVDQETGTLFAIPETTPFPGNLALGATRDPELARRMGRAVGRELAAMGANVNLAPVCDVNINPKNSAVGARSFGQDANLVAQMVSAYVQGLQEVGVAATAKHFPGHGDTAMDSHYGTPVVDHDGERLRAVEFPPFRAAIDAGARLVLTAHIALPRLDSQGDLPATLSPLVLKGILRQELGFRGVIITDAMDMQSIAQERGMIVDSITAAVAGVDVFLSGPAQAGTRVIYDSLLHAAWRNLISPAEIKASAARIIELKQWCGNIVQSDLEVVNCVEHNALADEIAARSITLVRDNSKQLPLRLAPDARVLVIVPTPQDLTPADTSSYETVRLADALRAYHARVDEIILPIDPGTSDIAALRALFGRYDQIIIGTINATDHAGQAALVNAALEANPQTIVVALRMPYDLQCFTHAPTFLCTYSIQPPSLRALARVLFGQASAPGVLPISIPELYPVGHGGTTKSLLQNYGS
jgi:beta-N-acetylhexosaminidase